MRFFILALLCSVSMSASAQWWRVGPLKHDRFPLLTQAKNPSAKKSYIAKVATPKINRTYIVSLYDLKRTEKMIMKMAQHNMRFREWNDASYNFSQLAQNYIQQGRLSEAKWFLLQSTMLSRRQSDDRHTYANLVTLAAVKIDMGEVTLARQDLNEALDMANVHGWILESRQAETKLKAIQGILTLAPKADFKYDEAVELAAKSK